MRTFHADTSLPLQKTHELEDGELAESLAAEFARQTLVLGERTAQSLHLPLVTVTQRGKELRFPNPLQARSVERFAVPRDPLH